MNFLRPLVRENTKNFTNNLLTKRTMFGSHGSFKDIHASIPANNKQGNILAGFIGVYMFIHFVVLPEEHAHRTEVEHSYLGIDDAEFPWGDGQTPLFDHLLGRSGDHH
eukprot:TRINITY_DN878_c0_g1_i1.p2 TRINITY_DN878_c0_g1~~TRINITY_DN878_c0_g1_i1.p2  ORF type:complete len:108 (-),score=15.02 TRINITY_DN878_c0_g1_i1:33-356(-)